MNPESILAKSEKGFEEIEKRTHRLGPRQRQALIRIDGVKTLDEHLGEAGDMADALYAQIEELLAGGFLVDLSPVEAAAPPEPEPVPAPPPPPPQAPAPAPKTVAAAPAIAPAPKPVAPPPAPPPPKPAPVESAAVEFNSPVKLRLFDLLVSAVGVETGKIGMALEMCRNRDDLSRWVDSSAPRIQELVGKAKAQTFYKSAKKLVG